MSLLNMNQLEPVRDMPSDSQNYEARSKRPLEDDLRRGLELALQLKKDIDILHPYVTQFVHKLFNY